MQKININETETSLSQVNDNLNISADTLTIPTDKPFLICNIPSPQMVEINLEQRVFPYPKFHKYGNGRTKLSSNVKYIVHYPSDLDSSFLKDVLEYHCNIVGKVSDEMYEYIYLYNVK